MSGRPLVVAGGAVVVLVLAANVLYRPTENTWITSAVDHSSSAGAATSHVAHDLPLPAVAQSDDAARCALQWRPGLVPRIAPSNRTAWLGSQGAQRQRLDRFFAKLLRGERVTVYFLGESVTRGSGADHTCVTCRDEEGHEPPPRSVHTWVNRSLIGGTHPPSCELGSAREDPYRQCSRVEGAADCPLNTTVCFPRNAWRCYMVHWLERAFPGQIDFRISAKPLLFMASCFARSLAKVDLVVHEYAVNGGGRMLCLQERIIRAALMGAQQPAVLMLLWLPKHYKPPPPETIMTQVQAGLRALGVHYQIPTLVMTRAFELACPPHATERWCYKRDLALGGKGFLHADMYHPNADGHSFFAAHILELLERSLSEVVAHAVSVTGHASAPLPKPLHELNRGLDSTAEGGKNLCLPVEEMEQLSTRNTGWQVVTEVTKANVKRLPALQSDAVGASIEWELDVRGVLWLIVTFMQSYAGFGAIDVQCLRGCSCRLHERQASADVDGVGAEATGLLSIGGHNYINATNARARTSEPQWRILTLSDQSQRCTVRVTTSAEGKFKLMLLSLIRVGNLDEAQTSTKDAQAALLCFGVQDSASRGHGMIRTGERLKWDHFTLDESDSYTKDH
jgi:hypothetical protein